MPCIDCDAPVVACFEGGRLVASDRCEECLDMAFEVPAQRLGTSRSDTVQAGSTEELVAAILARTPGIRPLKPTKAAVPAKCAEPDCERPCRKRGLCCTHYNRRFQPHRSHGPSAAEWAKANPERYRVSWQNKKHARRARKRESSVESIDRRIVGERDGWRCGICRKKINPALAWPHPLSQSLDHIEPMSKGGAHIYANVRIAHLRCNTARGNRCDQDQLALI